jgi:CHAD domain-containing protein
VELVEGDDDDLTRLGRLLRRAGARRSDGRPKLMRVLGLEPDPVPGRRAPTLDHVRSMLAAQLTVIETHDPGVRLGDDPEDVHRMRVATRRARALIGATRPLLGDVLVPLGEELKWLAGLLGAVRDLDVLLERIRGDVASLDEDRIAAAPLVAALEERCEDERVALLAGLAEERYVTLLDRFEAELTALAGVAVDGGVRAIAKRGTKRLRSAAEALPAGSSDAGSSDEELHQVRKRVKEARYAAELAAPSGGRRAARYVEALKAVQDVIGEHQDAVVAEERIRSLVTPHTALAGGRLIERERSRKAQARAAAPAALAAALACGRNAF